jgi:hypothetical protein
MLKRAAEIHITISLGDDYNIKINEVGLTFSMVSCDRGLSIVEVCFVLKT